MSSFALSPHRLTVHVLESEKMDKFLEAIDCWSFYCEFRSMFIFYDIWLNILNGSRQSSDTSRLPRAGIFCLIFVANNNFLHLIFCRSLLSVDLFWVVVCKFVFEVNTFRKAFPINFCSHQKLFGMHLHFSRPLDPIDLIWVVLFVLQLRLQGLFLPDKKFFFFIFFIFVIFDYLNITKHLSKKSNFCLQEETQF